MLASRKLDDEKAILTSLDLATILVATWILSALGVLFHRGDVDRRQLTYLRFSSLKFLGDVPSAVRVICLASGERSGVLSPVFRRRFLNIFGGELRLSRIMLIDVLSTSSPCLTNL